MSECDTEHETPPPLSDFDPWKIGQPDDGIVYLYQSDVDGFWRVIKDEDFALQEATGYPIGELVEHEERGDYEDSESGELRAIYLPPAENSGSDDTVECAGCGRSIDALRETHYRVSEEERPVPDRDDMEFEDWFSRSWYICRDCISRSVDTETPQNDGDREA